MCTDALDILISDALRDFPTNNSHIYSSLFPLYFSCKRMNKITNQNNTRQSTQECWQKPARYEKSQKSSHGKKSNFIFGTGLMTQFSSQDCVIYIQFSVYEADFYDWLLRQLQKETGIHHINQFSSSAIFSLVLITSHWMKWCSGKKNKNKLR